MIGRADEPINERRYRCDGAFCVEHGAEMHAIRPNIFVYEHGYVCSGRAAELF